VLGQVALDKLGHGPVATARALRVAGRLERIVECFERFGASCEAALLAPALVLVAVTEGPVATAELVELLLRMR
jgi:hypothetical protein